MSRLWEVMTPRDREWTTTVPASTWGGTAMRSCASRMTPRDRALLYSPPIAALIYFAAAYVVGRWQDAAVDRGVRLRDRLRL